MIYAVYGKCVTITRTFVMDPRTCPLDKITRRLYTENRGEENGEREGEGNAKARRHKRKDAQYTYRMKTYEEEERGEEEK